MHDQPISPLRQRMLDAMAVRNFSDKTRHDYIRQVKSFASFLGRSPDTAGADDLRRFQLHQRHNGVQPSSMNSAVSALRFFFGVTLDRPDMERHLTFNRSHHDRADAPDTMGRASSAPRCCRETPSV